MYWLMGAIGLVVLVLLVRKILGGPRMSSKYRPGTRAWEAQLTLDPLQKTIENLKREVATADEKRRARIEKELPFLEKQIVELNAIMEANDGSPGKGYVGFDRLPKDE